MQGGIGAEVLGRLYVAVRNRCPRGRLSMTTQGEDERDGFVFGIQFRLEIEVEGEGDEASRLLWASHNLSWSQLLFGNVSAMGRDIGERLAFDLGMQRGGQ